MGVKLNLNFEQNNEKFWNLTRIRDKKGAYINLKLPQNSFLIVD